MKALISYPDLTAGLEMWKCEISLPPDRGGFGYEGRKAPETKRVLYWLKENMICILPSLPALTYISLTA